VACNIPYVRRLLGATTHVPVRVKFSGCLFSIVASIVLTIVLNLLLRSCS
jgi:hypothetical protein